MAEEWKEREGGLEEDTWILIVDNSLEGTNWLLLGLHNAFRFKFD